MTKSQIAKLDAFLSTKQFATGHSWTRAQFIKTFQGHFPNLRGLGNSKADDMASLAAYTNINKLLRMRGMYIKSSGYQSAYTILNTTQKKVDKLDRVASNIHRTRAELLMAMRNGHKVYTSLTALEQASIENEAPFSVR